jgi:hypothetical protein
MSLSLFKKSVILREWNPDKYAPNSTGLEITHRKQENNEDYATLAGTKAQINQYLQDVPLLSERLRTLNSLPKYRIINTRKVRIQ